MVSKKKAIRMLLSLFWRGRITKEEARREILARLKPKYQNDGGGWLTDVLDKLEKHQVSFAVDRALEEIMFEGQNALKSQ